MLSGTKAETLKLLSDLGFNVPEVYYFTVEEWNDKPKHILHSIKEKFSDKLVAVRSSTLAEDSSDSSMAGAFESLLNVKVSEKHLTAAIEKVILSFDDSIENQVLIQPMVRFL